MIADATNEAHKGIGIRVLVNGVDVTDRAFYADDDAGFVRVWKVNGKGQKYIIGSSADPENASPYWPWRLDPPPCDGYGTLAQEELHGAVRIEWPA